MNATTVILLELLALVPSLSVGDKPETQTPMQQFHMLIREYETTLKEHLKAIKDAKALEDKEKLNREMNSQTGKYAQRFLTLAEDNPKTPAAVEAMTWILGHLRSPHISDPQHLRSKAMIILLRDHVESEKIIIACRMQSNVFSYTRGVESRKLLVAVLEKNPHRAARAQACLALADQTANRVMRAGAFKEQPDLSKRWERMLGKEAVAALVKEDMDKLSEEADSFYERTAKEFGDVPDLDKSPLGKKAQQKREAFHLQLEALRKPILVGHPVPEIETEDIQGKKFKLSDYRGKIVLLDFWGNWCPSCRAMYTHERSLVKHLEGKPFVLIGVNSDRDRSKLQEIIVKEKIPWRSFWDKGGMQGHIPTRWHVELWPTLFLIDAKGILRHRHLGSPGDKILDEEIEKLIAEAESTAASK